MRVPLTTLLRQRIKHRRAEYKLNKRIERFSGNHKLHVKIKASTRPKCSCCTQRASSLFNMSFTDRPRPEKLRWEPVCKEHLRKAFMQRDIIDIITYLANLQMLKSHGQPSHA